MLPIGVEDNLKVLRPPWTGSQSDALGAWSHGATCGAVDAMVWGLHVTLAVSSSGVLTPLCRLRCRA
jgi:hypothetical protein